jgi:hypothetical protein
MSASLRWLALLCAGVLVLGRAGGAETAALNPDERDRQVLEAALLHLLAQDDFTFARKPAAADDIIVLLPRSPQKRGFLLPGQIASDLRDVKDVKVPDDLVRNLQKRNTPPNAKPNNYDAVAVSYAGLNFSPRIAIDETDEDGMVRAKHPKARGWAEAFLPAYSTDGNTALLRCIIGPSPHGATATILLEKTAKGWVVKWHDFAWYA